MKDLIKMYFDEKIVKDFAEHEQNEKNFKVAEVIDTVIVQTIWKIDNNFKAAELWWGAHPDRYHQFFEKLLKNNWSIDWVDISPYMLKLAREYINTDQFKNRLNVIEFIENDIISYLQWIKNESLNLAIMKYTIDHMQDIDLLFSLLSKKLKKWGVLVSSVWVLSPELKSISTNARFLYNWREFPENETRTLKDWDTFTVKFFIISWKPEFWYIEWGETTKFYHSKEKYEETAKKYWFKIFVWDWKQIIKWNENEINQDILVLKKE